MIMYKISLQKLPLLMAAIAKDNMLFVPARNSDGKVDFAPYADNIDVAFDALLTAKSIKDFFFPQVENLLRFQTEGKHLSLEQVMPSDTPYVVMGARACDVRSLSVLDRVFLADPVDSYYQKHREMTTIIGMVCSEPEETCFCGSFGIDPGKPESDVVTYIVEDYLYWQEATEKGKALTSKLLDICLLEKAQAAEEEACEQQAEAASSILGELPLGGFKYDDELYADELKTFNAPQWESLSANCLSCCTCTFVCPTCHCYDIRDYKVDEQHTQRYRCWDSCMHRDFTKMAAANPRKTKLARFRQRYMHKLVYFPENHNGVYACVGCGRCLAKCPVSLNIVKVAKALEGKKNV